MAMTETSDASSVEDRVERLEDGQSRILGKLDELLGTGHAKAEQHTEQRLDRPSTIEEQVRSELAKAEAEKSAAAKADAEKAEHMSVAEQVAELRAKLTEQKPQRPQPKRERVMWGKP
jgi:uncharacterized protein YjcR